MHSAKQQIAGRFACRAFANVKIHWPAMQVTWANAHLKELEHPGPAMMQAGKLRPFDQMISNLVPL
ncbi:MAG TPA: hypothetical protein VGF67_28245 [Ktedonobacteraceae bacterium]|jgi:hypothetical protein